MSSTTRKRIIDAPIVVALVVLVALAVVTIIIVINNNSSSTNDPHAGPTATTEATPTDEPAGAQTSSDGAFTFDFPAGYEDAMDQVSASTRVAAAYDVDSTSELPPTIIVTTESAKGLSLGAMADAVVSQMKKTYSTSLDKISDYPIDNVDGEKLIAYNTGEYESSGQTMQSHIVIALHNGTAYGFFVNNLPDDSSTAGDALVTFIESVRWTDNS